MINFLTLISVLTLSFVIYYTRKRRDYLDNLYHNNLVDAIHQLDKKIDDIINKHNK